ncbi:MAG: hypothetical protein GX617_04180 [Lentisphaerae bacterium]|nr:hypothetical protein [Lentisphaerota bacterium]
MSARHGLVDLKTCDSLRYFENDCRRYGYIHQLAFYRAVIRQASGETLPVHIIAVEKNEPYTAGVGPSLILGIQLSHIYCNVNVLLLYSVQCNKQKELRCGNN